MKGIFSKKLVASALAVMVAASSSSAIMGGTSDKSIELPIIPYDGPTYNAY